MDVPVGDELDVAWDSASRHGIRYIVMELTPDGLRHLPLMEALQVAARPRSWGHSRNGRNMRTFAFGGQTIGFPVKTASTLSLISTGEYGTRDQLELIWPE